MSVTPGKNYSEDWRSPENAGIKRGGVIVDIQNEDRFSPVNTFAYSPLSPELFSLDNAALLFLAVKYSKTEADRKLLANIITKYMASVTEILTSIVATGKSHPLNGLNAFTTFAVVAHRFGIITDSGYLKIADQTRSIVDKLIQINFADMALDGLVTLVESGKVIAGTTLLPAETITLKALGGVK